MESGSIAIVNGRVVISPADGEVWMTKHEIADLFGCFVAKVDANARSILKGGVLDEDSVCRCQNNGAGGFPTLYNLEMITALAFRIRSRNADLFRRWLMERATHRPGKPISVFVPWSDNMLSN